MPNDQKLLQETYRLTKENNLLLRRMRRSAFWGRLFTLIFYAALLLAPIWFYWHYLNGTVQNLLAAYDRVEGTGTQAESEYQQFQQALQNFQQKLQGAAATSTPAQQ